VMGVRGMFEDDKEMKVAGKQGNDNGNEERTQCIFLALHV